MQQIRPSNYKQVGNNYTSGDAAVGKPSSIVPPELIDSITKEILTVITSNGITPSIDTNQLYTAISKMIQDHPQVKYLYNNYLDLAGYTGDEINNKNTTQLKSVLSKFLKMTSSLATDKQAGTVIVGNSLTVSNGVINVKNTFTELSTCTTVGKWTINKISVDKHLYIKYIRDTETDKCIIKQLSGIKYPCKFNYTFKDDETLILVPSNKDVIVDVLNIAGTMIAYQY